MKRYLTQFCLFVITQDHQYSQRIEIKMDYNNVPHKFTSKISAKLKEMKLILLRAQSKDMLWTKEYACFDSFSAKNRN